MSPNLRGALFMCIAMASFTINDTFVKLATDHMTLGQIIMFRGIFSAALLALVLGRHINLQQIKRLANRAVIIRTIFEIAATVSFLIALKNLQIAFITAILQTLPLLVTIGAALFFKEPVGWRRWSAILIGLIGMLIIVRPGLDGFNSWSIIALISVLFCAIRDLATRAIPNETNSTTVSLLTTISVAIVGALILEPMGGWQPLPMEGMTLVFCASVALAIGYHCTITGMRLGNVSSVVPFRYTGLIWGIFLGFAVFGDIPDLPMLIGGAIIVLSGLYTLARERTVSKKLPITKSTHPSMAPDGL